MHLWQVAKGVGWGESKGGTAWASEWWRHPATKPTVNVASGDRSGSKSGAGADRSLHTREHGG
jgi:hypothetical protein